MSARKKQFVSEAATLAQYDAINAALGLPRRDQHRGGGRHVDQDDPSRPGWTLEGASIADGPGPTAFIVIDEPTAAELDGVQPPGHVRINLGGRDAHDPTSELGANPPFRRRVPVRP